MEVKLQLYLGTVEYIPTYIADTVIPMSSILTATLANFLIIFIVKLNTTK